MRNSMTLAAIAAMGLLGACVGGIENPPPGGDDDDGPIDTNRTARQIFDTDVLPLLSNKCAACHVGPETTTVNMFLGETGPSGFYAALEKDRAVVGGWVADSATLLTKPEHAGPQSEWTSGEAAKITAWLNKEATERGGTDPTPVDPNSNRTTKGASMIFAGCMATLQAAYTQTQAYQIANLNTTNNGRCYSCHEPGGAGGIYLGRANNYIDMFNKWQEEVFFTGVFQAQIQPGTPPTFKIGAAESKLCNKGTEKQNNLGTHPAFDCRQNNSTALNQFKAFITQVQTKIDAGGCGTPGFKPSTP